MTVITHALTEKKLQKEPLVPADVTDAAAGRDPETGRALTLVRVVRRRLQPVRERGPLLSTCVFLTAFLLFCAGMAASAYLYQQYEEYQVTAAADCFPIVANPLSRHRRSSAITAAGAASPSRQ